jgi:hypothetical protein
MTPDSYQVRAKLIRAANTDNLQGRLHLQIATLWLPATSRGDATAVLKQRLRHVRYHPSSGAKVDITALRICA